MAPLRSEQMCVVERLTYGEKDTGSRKLLRCTSKFCENFMNFAGRLSKSRSS
jgi:hypothetical protein